MESHITRNPSAAQEFQPDALTRLVLNLDLTFHWIAGSDSFWFKRQTRTGDEFVLFDAATGEQTLLREPIETCTEARVSDRVLSPDRRYAVLCRQHNLWLRDMVTRAERPLTEDGVPDFGYGDVDPSYDREVVSRRRKGQPNPLRGVIWSPDGRFIGALRQDLRAVPERLFVTEYVPPDDTYTHPHPRKIFTANDPPPISEISVFDTSTLVLRKLAIDPQALNDLALHYFIEGIVWWSSAATTLTLITANHGGSRFAVISVDLDTGRAQEILAETSRFNVRLNPFDCARPNVHVTADASEIVWYSERSGFGHLYLHDARTGRLKHAMTEGNWVVFDLLRVDEDQRLAYFTASSREAGANPYYRYLYRVSLDGGQPQLLTPEIADHKFSNVFFLGAYRLSSAFGPAPGSSMSPDGRYFVDSYSRTDLPPEYIVRRTSGECVAKLLSADASDLYAAGWQPPHPVVAKAADGLTDLYGVITYPRDFDAARLYPVIDSMYPGPQGSFAPRTFMEQLMGGPIHHLQTFADAGFIVIAVDGRGTGYRSRAFRDAFLASEDVFGAADHVAAIESLAAERPYMDLGRVGVRGQSFGGYGALRAMLLFPDFFRVGVAATGPAGYLDAEGQTNVERFFGVPSKSVEARQHYDRLSNTRLAFRLDGRVLLIYGGIDESVPLKHAFAVFDAFINADKDIDMLILPNSAHAAPKEPYVIRRSVQYFLEHLAGKDRCRHS